VVASQQTCARDSGASAPLTPSCPQANFGALAKPVSQRSTGSWCSQLGSARTTDAELLTDGSAGAAGCNNSHADGGLAGMEGYLSKQSGGKQGSSSKGELMRKWDRRYFVLRAGSTQLKYYRTKEDYCSSHPSAGCIDTAGATLKVDRSGGACQMQVITPSRTLAVRADSMAVLDHWLHTLSSGSRAQNVIRDEAPQAQSTSGSSKLASQRSMQLDRDKPVKVLLLGDTGVGKTCVLQRFADGTFVSSTRATVGMDLKRTSIDLDGDGSGRVTLQVWDTAGQEMFRSIISSYYRGAHGVILMFDLTRQATFESLPVWLDEVRAKAAEDVACVLVGNKKDCPHREVSSEEAADWAARNRMRYVEASAKEGTHVQTAFITLVATITGRADELEVLLDKATVYESGSAMHTDQEDSRGEADVVKLEALRPQQASGTGGCGMC